MVLADPQDYESLIRAAPTGRQSATTSTSTTPSRPTWRWPPPLTARSCVAGPGMLSGCAAVGARHRDPPDPRLGAQAEPDVRGAGTLHGETDRQFLDSTAIREELGWAPRVGLDEGSPEPTTGTSAAWPTSRPQPRASSHSGRTTSSALNRRRECLATPARIFTALSPCEPSHREHSEVGAGLGSTLLTRPASGPTPSDSRRDRAWDRCIVGQGVLR